MAVNQKIMTVGAGTIKLADAAIKGDSSAGLLDFSGEVSEVTIEPSVKEGDSRQMLNGDTVDSGTKYEYTLKATVEQNLTAKGIAGYSIINAGKIKYIEFVPNTLDGAKFTGQVRIDPTSIGGEAGQANTSDLELKFIDAPSFTPATKVNGLAP
ncbi:TPA: hypothetical protein ACGIZG_001597 [Corynebacterium striatum]|nr:hypothetical protein [Corynebacterium striatum]HAT6563679.1 hypothetical protein [Corynebacterium striatum]HAT6569031.1 hypothetical protein [Corynebacterium striatum]HAT6625302.1 hypothetical protein [Corynebacterium striatum]HCG2976165.1 hypothetical protein [Corynebacterium striatum]